MIYSPPEVISEVNLNSNTKIDIWFLGVILFIILTKQYPFIGNHDYKTFTSIIKDKLKFPNSIKLSKEVHNLIHHMLDKNPQHRYLIVEIKLHPWISDYFRPTKISMLSETIFSETSDYYDDTNPDNKFNYSKRMFSDQTLLSKMSTLNRIPSLSPPSNRKSSYKGNMQASNLLNLLISSRKLPEIKDLKNEEDRDIHSRSKEDTVKLIESNNLYLNYKDTKLDESIVNKSNGRNRSNSLCNRVNRSKR